MAQTAVEWFYKNLIVYMNGDGDFESAQQIYEQAKAMEKAQHGSTWNEAIDTHERRGHVIARSIVDFDDYYNETYNK